MFTKTKFTYYFTPREIVHYMCQESLINYLENETGIYHDYIEIFIKYGEIIKDVDINTYKKEDYKMPKVIVDNFEKIDEALENVKIADPAVGSGAFPLGMLNEIVKSRSIITDYVYKNSTEIDMFDSRSIYNLKKNTMKKSIFAVDIEPSAVDITKLRLWLSLVVDADIKTVNTLPNLDYNIMVGNSLIEDFRGIKLFDEELLKEKPRRKQVKESRQISMNIDENNEINIGIEQEYQLLEDIQSLQSKLFDTKDTEIKKSIKKEIEDKEWELIEYKLNREKGLSFKEIQELKKQRKLHKRPYFLWKLEFSKVFKENGGFDIVISNPPYVRQENITELKEVLKKTYSVYSPRADLYVYFYELAYKLLKNGGNSAFITSNKWMRNKYGQNIRKFFKNNTKLIQIIDFGGYKVFDTATVDTNILLFEKNIDEQNEFTVCNIGDDFNKKLDIKTYFSSNKIKYKQCNIDCNCFSFQKEAIMSIKNRVEYVGKRLKEWNISIRSGFKTGLNEAFIIDKKTKEMICSQDPNSINIIKKNLRGKDVKKYKCEWNELWIIMAKYDFHKEVDKYPAIKNYLYKFEDRLKARGQCKYSRSKKINEESEIKGQHHWIELDNNPREEQIKSFETIPKILYPDISKGPSFYYDEEGYFSQETCFCITGDNLKYLVGVLNTKAITYIYTNFYAGGSLGNKSIRYKKSFIEQLPIPIPSEDDKNKIEQYVDLINNNIKNNGNEIKYIQEIEDKINEIVYDLYGFTEEQRKIISDYNF